MLEDFRAFLGGQPVAGAEPLKMSVKSSAQTRILALLGLTSPSVAEQVDGDSCERQSRAILMLITLPKAKNC